MRASTDHAGWDRGILFCTYDLLISGEGGKAAARRRATASLAASRAAGASGLKGAAETPGPPGAAGSEAAGGVTPPPPVAGGGATPGGGGMTPGMTPGVTPGMTPGVTPGLTPGVTPGATPGQQQQEGEGEDGADGEFGKMPLFGQGAEGGTFPGVDELACLLAALLCVSTAEPTRRTHFFMHSLSSFSLLPPLQARAPGCSSWWSGSAGPRTTASSCWTSATGQRTACQSEELCK